MSSVDLSDVSGDVLASVFEHLDASDVFTASLCSRKWRRVAEDVFASRCRARGWRLPRRPRGVNALTCAPWRRLFMTSSCRRCIDGRADFPITTQHFPIQVFSLCERCVVVPTVVARLQELDMHIDMESVGSNPRTLEGLLRCRRRATQGQKTSVLL